MKTLRQIAIVAVTTAALGIYIAHAVRMILGWGL
jgi:hypothetical protein